MRNLTSAELLLAAQCAERHRIPKATVAHPAVIVPDDPFMTEKLRDPDYVPYCSPCVPMQRLRRVADGFQCPTCGNKTNYDLTRFNGNVGVQYAQSAGAQAAAPEGDSRSRIRNEKNEE